MSAAVQAIKAIIGLMKDTSPIRASKTLRIREWAPVRSCELPCRARVFAWKVLHAVSYTPNNVSRRQANIVYFCDFSIHFNWFFTDPFVVFH